MNQENRSEMAWINTSIALPPEGEVVETKIDDEEDGVRNEQQLVRKGSLWFFPDYSMYVYYRPTHWHRLAALSENQTPSAKEGR